jgi:hypothetical protein
MKTHQHIKIALLLLLIQTSFSAILYAGKIRDIHLSNIHGTKFTISWVSEEDESAMIRYGASVANYENWQVAYDVRGDNTIDDIHYITTHNLIPDTLYYYEMISGELADNNSGRYYRLNPGPALAPRGGSCQPAGKVYKDINSLMPAYDTIVYLNIIDATAENNSLTESCLVTQSTSGYWAIDLINTRTKANNAYYSFECGISDIHVKAQSGRDGTAQLITKSIDFVFSNETETIRPDLIVQPAIPPDLFIDVDADGKMGLKELIYLLKMIVQ